MQIESKFEIGDTVFVIGCKESLPSRQVPKNEITIRKEKIIGVLVEDNGIFYRMSDYRYFKEEFIFKDFNDCCKKANLILNDVDAIFWK